MGIFSCKDCESKDKQIKEMMEVIKRYEALSERQNETIHKYQTLCKDQEKTINEFILKKVKESEHI